MYTFFVILHFALIKHIPCEIVGAVVLPCVICVMVVVFMPAVEEEVTVVVTVVVPAEVLIVVRTLPKHPYTATVMLRNLAVTLVEVSGWIAMISALIYGENSTMCSALKTYVTRQILFQDHIFQLLKLNYTRINHVHPR